MTNARVDEKRNTARNLLTRSWALACVLHRRMPIEVTGTPVEVTGVPIDIVANAPGVEGSAPQPLSAQEVKKSTNAEDQRVQFGVSQVFEIESLHKGASPHAYPLAKARSPSVAARRPPTKESDGEAYKFYTKFILTGIMFLASYIPGLTLARFYTEGYYKWPKVYCEETGLASWWRVTSWVGVGVTAVAANQLLITFWCIGHRLVISLLSGIAPQPGDEELVDDGWAAIKRADRTRRWLDRLQILIMCFYTGWICSGQSEGRGSTSRGATQSPNDTHAHLHLTLCSHRAAGMIRATVGCEDDVYVNITSGVWPGCMTASDGHVTCDLEPRPGCCYNRLHNAASAYSYAGIVYCCTFMPLLLFFNGHLIYTVRGGED